MASKERSRRPRGQEIAPSQQANLYKLIEKSQRLVEGRYESRRRDIRFLEVARAGLRRSRLLLARPFSAPPPVSAEERAPSPQRGLRRPGDKVGGPSCC